MTGLLYLIVIGMWAAVLLPIFLKKYDQTQAHKAVGITNELKSWRFQPKAQSTPRQQSFIRRRRVLMTLLTATVLSFLAAMSGLFSLYWTALPTLLLVGFVYLAIQHGHKVTIQPRSYQPTQIQSSDSFRQQDTVAIALDNTVQVQEEPVRNTWEPVEPPVPAYVKAARATAIPRAIEATKPWTGQDMVEHAAKLRAEHAQRIKEAQRRLEEARAISMEKARRAALAVRPTVVSVDNESTKQAVNE